MLKISKQNLTNIFTDEFKQKTNTNYLKALAKQIKANSFRKLIRIVK